MLSKSRVLWTMAWEWLERHRKPISILVAIGQVTGMVAGLVYVVRKGSVVDSVVLAGFAFCIGLGWKFAALCHAWVKQWSFVPSRESFLTGAATIVVVANITLCESGWVPTAPLDGWKQSIVHFVGAVIGMGLVHLLAWGVAFARCMLRARAYLERRGAWVSACERWCHSASRHSQDDAGL